MILDIGGIILSLEVHGNASKQNDNSNTRKNLTTCNRMSSQALSLTEGLKGNAENMISSLGMRFTDEKTIEKWEWDLDLNKIIEIVRPCYKLF